MSLYGALFGGVSGLRAQSSKIGIISDNIANVNTIGYKQAKATFQTLVVNANGSVSYQTGGVRGGTQLNISKQGLLQSTESPTDIAISGGGFFVVKAVAPFDTAATPYYTRAGSFTQDSLGNFINTQGFYLQGWPLDRDGRLPGETGNLNTASFTDLTSLRTVNVESASGSAQATSTLELGANLKASESVFPGQTGSFSLDANNTANLNQPADAIIVGAEYGLASADSVTRGDSFNVTTGNGLVYTYEYGGYTTGRDVTTPASNYGDNNYNNLALVSRGAVATDITYRGTSSFDLTIPNHGLITGDRITLAGLTAKGTTPASELNATHSITWVDANTVRITTASAHGQVAGTNPAADAFTVDKRVTVFQGNILDATSASGNFLQLTTTAGFTPAALTFTATNPTSGTVTFRYTTSSPNTLNGEFNNLSTLASALDGVTGLTARVVGGRLVVGAEDANEAVTFANGDATGATDGSKRGIDWISELDITDIPAGSRRFSSIQGLADLSDADDGISSSVDNPLSSPTLNIRVDDPLDTIQFDDLGIPFSAPTAGTPLSMTAGTYTAGTVIPLVIDMGVTPTVVVGDNLYLSGFTSGFGGLPGNLPNGGPFQVTAVSGTTFTVGVVATQSVTATAGPFAAPSGNAISVIGTSNHGSLLAHLFLENNSSVASLAGATYSAALSSGALGPQYDPTGTIGKNMASGGITAQFSRNIRIYDSLGSGHDVRMSFIKTATNTWAIEVHAIPETDITTGAGFANGQIATGTIVFNGDGTLRSVSASLTNPIDITWRNGASASQITLDLGTAGQQFGTAGATAIGLADGLSQFDSGYNVNFANQNGAPVGQLVSVSIDDDGFVIASYSNGETQSLYKLPLADFANPDGLSAVTGNVYVQTRESGEQNLREAGTNGTGTVVSAALEQSNVDLAEQLTDMIVAQRSYQANTKVIKTADELLEQLNQI